MSEEAVEVPILRKLPISTFEWNISCKKIRPVIIILDRYYCMNLPGELSIIDAFLKTQ
jgi:hypothetical protein